MSRRHHRRHDPNNELRHSGGGRAHRKARRQRRDVSEQQHQTTRHPSVETSLFRPPQNAGETTTLPFLAGTIDAVGKAAGKFVDTLFRPLDMLTGTRSPAYEKALSGGFDKKAEGVNVFGGKTSMVVPSEYCRSYNYLDLLNLTQEQLKGNPRLRVVYDAALMLSPSSAATRWALTSMPVLYL